ncbi:MAG: hypothetical protein IT379_16950 [Deltaproteobacteria bacterium]|nr:hypothetical protein [Deltaproteobacteria bacterium]
MTRGLLQAIGALGLVLGCAACGSSEGPSPPRREDPEPEPEPPTEEASRFCPALFDRSPTSGNPRPQNRGRPRVGTSVLREALREEAGALRRERDGTIEEGTAGHASDSAWGHYGSGALGVRIDVTDLVHVCTLAPGTGRALVENGRGLPPGGRRRPVVVEGHPALAVDVDGHAALSLVVADRCWVLVHANGLPQDQPVEAVTREIVDLAHLAARCR